MKKTLASVLTTALVVGAASTTFAAANPFSDVPAGHWAYDAVTQLAADGVIEGYGDNTFRGDQSITRYEMAQMIAKAMAKNPSGVDKAMLDRLAAEFSEELNNLGVRVANLEKHSDMVQWRGEVRYTYQSNRREMVRGEGKTKRNVNENLLRLEPKAEVNDHWTINARLDAVNAMKEDTATDVSLKRVWAQGDYKNFSIKLGKFPDLVPYDKNMMFFNQMSGVELNYKGGDFSAQVRAGRIAFNGDTKFSNAGYLQNGGLLSRNDDDAANIQSVALTYAPGKFSITGAYYHLSSEWFRDFDYSKDGNTDKANIWEAAASYRFDKNAALTAAYARNSKADFSKHAHIFQFDYKGAKPATKGSWGAHLAYRYLGANAVIDTSTDGVLGNSKGWEVGFAYIPFKNIQLRGIYSNGHDITNHGKTEKLFGRVEWFF